MASSIWMAYMGNLFNFFIALLMLGSISACRVDAVSPSTLEGPSVPKQTVVRITNPGTSAVLNTNNPSECVNYVEGRTFIGENYRFKFDHDGNVSVYGLDGHLVFGGTLELGATESEVSRWITARPISGGSALQFLLSNDGKLMEARSLMIYRPE